MASVSWTDTLGNLWLFGGSGYAASRNGLLNDLWKYDVPLNQWSWMTGDSTVYVRSSYGTMGTANSANTPGGREGSATWKDVSGNLWLFGGLIGNSMYINDLWKFNIITNEWTWMKGDTIINQMAFTELLVTHL
jgi:hypothetical protein